MFYFCSDTKDTEERLTYSDNDEYMQGNVKDDNNVGDDDEEVDNDYPKRFRDAYEIERFDDHSANVLNEEDGRSQITKRAVSNKVRVIKILMFADQSVVNR